MTAKRRSASLLTLWLVLGLTVALSGCKSITIPTSDGSVQISKDGDSFSVKTKDGEATVSGSKDGTVHVEGKDAEGNDVNFEFGGGELPDDFPKEVLVLQGAKVQGYTNASAEDENHYLVSIDVPRSFADTQAAYANLLKEAGYTVHEFKSDAMLTLSGEQGANTLSVVITKQDADKHTDVVVTYSTKTSS